MDKHLLAQWAKNLLNDDFFKEVLDNLKKEQISVIINTSAEESDRREDAYRHIKTLELITGHLEGLASETVIKEKKSKFKPIANGINPNTAVKAVNKTGV